MGFFDTLLGKEKALPALDPQSAAARRLEPFRPELERFLGRVNDRLELVPAASSLYAFIGKPPGHFGMVWWQDGAEHSFKSLMQEHGLTQLRIQKLSDELREAYKRHAGEERFSATVAGKSVTVTPSDTLAADVERMIRAVD